MNQILVRAIIINGGGGRNANIKVISVIGVISHSFEIYSKRSIITGIGLII